MPRKPKPATAMTRAREIREARGLTLTEAADKVKTGLPTIQKIENGTNGISRNMAPRLADAYSVPIPELYAEVGSPISPPVVDPKREGKFVEQPVQLHLLRIWEAMDDDTREALLILAERTLGNRPKRA